MYTNRKKTKKKSNTMTQIRKQRRVHKKNKYSGNSKGAARSKTDSPINRCVVRSNEGRRFEKRWSSATTLLLSLSPLLLLL
jgi:hypothetical protein